MKTLHGFVAVFVAVSCLSSSVFAKGPTTRIVIAAPSLAAAVEITDPALLKQFAVWAGPGTSVNGEESSEGFIIDWRAGVSTRRPVGLPRYKVSFYAKYANQPLASQSEYLAYVVWYEPDTNSDRGYVYLPGRVDDAFVLNTRTIVRGREGHWFNATDAWHQAVTRILGSIKHD
jgi:hypothetical protein